MVKKTGQGRALPTMILIIVIVSIIWFYYGSDTDETILPFQLSTEGYSVVDVNIDGSTLYLSTECYQFSMDISDTQAISIDRGLEKRIDRRPLSHDTIKDILDNFDIEVLMAKVESFDEGIFYARLVLRQDNKVIDIDSRPSDAVATAIRAGIPVYVKDELLLSYGIDTCRLEEWVR